MRISAAIASVAALTVLAGAASADTLRANYSTSYNRDFNATRAGNTNDVRTVTFNWTRTDAPGAGVDSTVPVNFDSYCIELTQTVGGGDHDYQVLTPAAAGLTGFQELMLERLWGSFKAGVTNDLKSAAFQASVWEIIYDAGSMDIRNDNFVVNAPSGGVRDEAQSYLDAITDGAYAGPVANLVVLHSENVQDQITEVPQIPAPATAALGLLGLGAMGRRRRSV